MCCKLVRTGGDGKISAEYVTAERSEYCCLSFAAVYLPIYLSVNLSICLSIYGTICIGDGVNWSRPFDISFCWSRRERIDEKVGNFRVGERYLFQGAEDPHDGLILRLFSTKEPNYWWLFCRKRHDIYGMPGGFANMQSIFESHVESSICRRC